MEDFKEALDWANEHRPDAPIAHKAAFFNAVIYLVTGGSSGVGGPSVREHLVSWSLAGPQGLVSTRSDALTVIYPDGSLPRPGSWEIEQAIAHCDPLCFGDIRSYRQQAELILKHEQCFDDDPADLEALRGKCLACGKILAPQARGQYCKEHRHLGQARRDQVKRARAARSR